MINTYLEMLTPLINKLNNIPFRSHQLDKNYIKPSENVTGKYHRWLMRG